MNNDVLLLFGVCLTTFVVGIEWGLRMQPDSQLPAPVQAMAQQLGELHVSHERAIKTKEEHENAKRVTNDKLDTLLNRLHQLFHWE